MQPEKVTTLNQDMTGGRHTANYTVVKNRTKDGYQLTVTAARRRSTPARRSLGVGWFEVERTARRPVRHSLGEVGSFSEGWFDVRCSVFNI